MGKQEEQSDPAQLWPASGLSQRTESDPLPVFSHLLELRFWAPLSLERKVGSPGYSTGKGVSGLASTHFPPPSPPIISLLGALNRPGFGASGYPHALPSGTRAHVHPSRLMYRPPPRMQTRACKYVRGPHLHTRSSRTAFLPRSGPGTRVHAGRPSHRAPTDRHPKTGGRLGAGGSPAAESGQPLPQGDPAGLGCVQRVSQALARKPQGRPVPVGCVHGPAVPQCPPPNRPRPLPPPQLRPGSPREPDPAGGPRARPALLLASPALGPRRSSRALLAPGASKSGESRSSGATPAPQHVCRGLWAGGSQELPHLGPGPARSIPGPAGRGALG